ncbi:hypothetical protein IAR50_006594 [Cryptococcus sp. DSM 104548]
MSKPKPGLGKGLVRTLSSAQHPSPSPPGTLALTLNVNAGQYPAPSLVYNVGWASGSRSSASAPVVGAGSAGGGSGGGGGEGLGRTSLWWNPGTGVVSTTPGNGNMGELVPSWDTPDIVLSSHPHSSRSIRIRPAPSSSLGLPSRSALLSSASVPSSAAAGSGSGSGGSGGAREPRGTRYLSTVASPLGSSSGVQGMYLFPEKAIYPSSPAQASLDALLQALQLTSPPSSSSSPPPPTPTLFPPRAPSPRTTHQSLKPRTSNPISPSSSGGSTASYSSSGASALRGVGPLTAGQDIPPTTYSPTLIFHLGASGSPKERLPSKSSPPPRPAIPPRQRSFPLPPTASPSAPQLQASSVSIGEDAYFTRSDGMCIADGVGAWARSGRGGADAGRWSRLLTHFCEREVDGWWEGSEVYLKEKKGAAEGEEEVRERRPLDPVEIMQRGYEKCLSCAITEGVNGSSTCLLALLQNSTLHIANLGDGCLLLIRGDKVVFRTEEMQHAFNFPMQVGTHSRDEPMKDAMRFDVPVKKGDIVVVGSDGLMDNMFDEDILETLSELRPSPHQTTFSPQSAASALCSRARQISQQTSTTTPFMCAAIEEGIDFVGGKKDDISVVVGVVGDRETGEGGGVEMDGQEGEENGKREGGLALHMS